MTTTMTTTNDERRVTEIPGGASPLQIPPRQHFKKFALPGKFFEMIKVVVVNYFLILSFLIRCAINAVTVIPLITLLIPQAIIAVITIINSN